MRKIVLMIIAVVSLSMAYGQTEDIKGISFKNLNHDYGNIEQGGNGVYEFEFTNTGTKPLVLTNVKSSCGCTVPTWPKEPIEAGKTGIIKVKYDTKRIGNFSKSITVSTNASNSPIILTISGSVYQK